MTTAQQYDAFSIDYHWLYSDHVLSGTKALGDNGDVLALADPKASILDASCGIGTLAIALAKLGYEVNGSDGSHGMVDQAILAARQAGINLPLKCCTWANLPDHFTNRFDLIFCLGNSIGHVRNKEEMVASLRGMRQVLKDRGKLVIESINWEQVRKEKTRFTHFQWRERAGQRCLPIYVWTFPENFDEAHSIEVLLVFETGGQASIRSYPIVYHPFRLEELKERFRCAGFSDTQIRFSANQAAYRVIAS
ncbi:MAG: methyltransferase domain-containing protein [Terracidiphilus sp.]